MMNMQINLDEEKNLSCPKGRLRKLKNYASP